MMIVIIRVAQIVVAWLPGWEKVETEKGNGGKREREFATLTPDYVRLKMDQI